MPKEQLSDSTWSDAVSNDPKHRPQVMDFSKSRQPMTTQLVARGTPSMTRLRLKESAVMEVV